MVQGTSNYKYSMIINKVLRCNNTLIKVPMFDAGKWLDFFIFYGPGIFTTNEVLYLSRKGLFRFSSLVVCYFILLLPDENFQTDALNSHSDWPEFCPI